MQVENPTIQGLITAMLIIIPLGGAYRVTKCAINSMTDEEKKSENTRRAKNAALFVIVAELSVIFVNIIYSYFG